MPDVAPSPQGEKPSIVQPGGKLRCPGCEEEGDCFYAFTQLDRPEKYKHDTNPVYKHRKDHGGCGHVFSPGDPWVMEAYLSGELVPRQMLTDLRSTIASLEALINSKANDNERRPAAA